MQGLTSSWPPRLVSRDGDQRRKVAVLVASLVFHAVVLGWLAASALGIGERSFVQDDTFIPVQLEPRPLLPGETARVRPPLAPDRSTIAQPLRGSAVVDPAHPLPIPTIPAPPAPRLAAAPPAEAPAPPADPWRLRPEDADAAVGRSLRGGMLGCRGMATTLSPAEQAACDQQLGAAASRAGPPGPRTLTAAEARREAGFARDGARALANHEAQRAPLAGGVGVVGPADCIGSNFGVGCAGAHLDPSIRQGATTNIRQRGNKTEAMRPIPGNE